MPISLTALFWEIIVAKVLIVDDSIFMRKALATLIESDPTIKIVGTANNGEEALKKIDELDPDVVTLDIEMPRMDGLTALGHIMRTKPRPVIMISSLTEEGAQATLKAMELGALDFLPKSLSAEGDVFGKELTKKIKLLARRKPLMQLRFEAKKTGAKPGLGGLTSKNQVLNPCVGPRDIIGIGVSTGGPPAVQKVLSALPKDFPATILIAQHMPAAFTGPFAKRLDGVSQISVSEAQHGIRPQAGHAYIAPGGRHMRLIKRGPLMEIEISDEPASALYKPSATELMTSIAQCNPRKSMGVILTGMGSDGLDGIRLLREKGGYIMAQSEASCVVYGMPKAIVDAKLTDQILDIDSVAEAMITAVKA